MSTISSEDKARLKEIKDQIRLAKEEEVQLDEEYFKHREDNKILYFWPHSIKQMEFFSKCTTKRRAVFAGNRFGKSTAGVIEDICWLLGYRPFFPEGDSRRYSGIPEAGVKGLVIAEDWDKVKEIFTESGVKTDQRGKFFEYLPAWSITGKHTNQNGVIDIIYVQSTVKGRIRKSAVYFDTVKSFKNNGAAHESSAWDFIHIDEPIPQAMWTAMSRGLIDRSGMSWWLMTPLKETWMYYYMTENAATDSGNFWYEVADADDNPLLSEVDKQLFYQGLTEDELACRKKGLPLAFGSLVYPNFDQKVHVFPGTCPKGWVNAYTPPEEWNTAFALDPHSKTPQAVLFVAWDEFNVIFYHEIFRKLLLEELALAIKQVTQKREFTHQICDPFAWNPDPVSGVPWAQHLWNMGLEFRKASKQRELGILQSRTIFSEKERKVFFLPHLHETLKEVRQHAYGKNEKPEDEDDHMMENFYRLCLATNNFQFLPNPVPWAALPPSPPSDSIIPEITSDMKIPEALLPQLTH